MRFALTCAMFLGGLSFALADDWTGKTIRVKENGLKLGRKVDAGLVRDGAALDAAKTYRVKADDGTYLELAGGFVFKADVEVAADEKPFPKEFKKEKEGDKPEFGGWAFGTKVIYTRRPEQVRFGDWKDGKQVSFALSGIMPMEVRKDHGDGWVRVHDQHREGWVRKDDLVTKDDAPIHWDKVLKANPADSFALYMRGVGWWQKGENDNAITDFTECIRLEPASAMAYNGRGAAWNDKKEYDKAIADLTEAIRLDPKDARPFYNRGNAWSDKKEYAKAIADYTEAIKLDPKDAHHFFNRGNQWLFTKQYDKAVADYTEAIRLDPKHVSAITSRGIAWANKKQYEKAIADYTEAVKLDSKYAYAYGNRAEASAKLKKYDDAVDGFVKALELNPMDWIHRDFAKFLASCPDAKYRDGKKAVELAKKAVEKAGKDADWEYLDALAMAYAEAGDFELAVAEQRKAIEMLKAEKNPDKDDVKAVEARLDLYRAKKPYRDE